MTDAEAVAPPRPRGKPKGPLAKVPCIHCGQPVTRGRPGKAHENGDCVKKQRLPEPTNTPPPPVPTSWGDGIPDLAELEKEQIGEDPTAASAQDSTPAPGDLPALDLSIIGEVMDPSVVKPILEVVPNTIIAWKMPHATTRLDASAKQVNGFIKFLPYILPKMMVNPFGLLLLYIGLMWAAPIGAAFAEERRWQALNKKATHPEPPKPEAKP